MFFKMNTTRGDQAGKKQIMIQSSGNGKDRNG